MLENTKKLIYIIILILFGFITTFSLKAQTFKDPIIIVANRVYVQYTDSLVEAFYYKGNKKVKTNDQLFYYWYAAQDIKHTRGGFEGKLLHGSYTMFYYNKDLLAKGNFKYGLKDGEWKSWHRGGEIKSKEKWKKGHIVGVAYYFDSNGKLKSHRKYTDQLGSGHKAEYDSKGNLVFKKYYKKNQLVKEIQYHQNNKDKTVITKPKKIKKVKKQKNKDKLRDDSNKKLHNKKIKKSKQPKVKIQKYRQISPGGIGA